MPLFVRPVRGGLLATAARTAVVAGTAQVVTGRIAARQRARAAALAPPPAGPSQPTAVDPTTETLRQLAGLRDDGVLSNEEFAAAKQRLLGLPQSPTA